MSARLDLPAFGAACLNSFSSNEMRIAYLFFGSAGLPRINGEINVAGSYISGYFSFR